MPFHRLALLLVLFAPSGSPADCAAGTPNNPYGVHLFIQDAMSPEMIEKHTTWARALVGERGYCKLFFYPITEWGAPETAARLDSWKLAVQACYEKQLIPIIRVGGELKNGIWQKPRDFKKTAEAIRRVVAELPKSDEFPLIIEVFNEPNLHIEWSGKTEPVEYAQFFVECSRALRSLKDSRIVIANGALSPGGDFDNVRFVSEVCSKVPEFVHAFDVWASHCYPGYPPEKNQHDGTMPPGSYTIDHYLDELRELEKFGRKDVRVIITETAYPLGPEGEDARADRMMRAFRDYWSRWPEVLAVTPYQFCDPFGGNEGVNWVYPDSGTGPDGLPTRAHAQYWAVQKLAKPTDSTGAISGKVTEADFGAPLAGARITLSPGEVSTASDAAGNYFFPRLAPGRYSLRAELEHFSASPEVTAEVKAGENTVVDFALASTSKVTLRGTVRDSVSGLPLSGVTVTATPGGFSAVTDENGQYLFVGIPPSTYALRSQKAGYYPFGIEGVAVKPEEVRTVDWFTAPGAFPAKPSIIGPQDFEGAEGRALADGWTSVDGSSDPAVFHVDRNVRYTGQASQRITPDGSKSGAVWSISNYGEANTGKRYAIRVWCRTENADGRVRAIGRFFSNAMEPAGEFETVTSLSGSNGWTLLWGSGVASEFGALKEKAGRLQVVLEADIASGAAWFDTIWVGEHEGPVLPPPVIDFSASPGKFSAQLSWRLADGTDSVRIVCKPGSYPSGPEDGKVVQVPGGITAAAVPDLHPSSGWYFAAYAVAADGTLSEPVYAFAQPEL